MKTINLIIESIEVEIRKKLGIEKRNKTTGEKVLEQFVSEYNDLETSDQFRVLTAMPRDAPREELQNLFGVSEKTARRAKKVQNEKDLLSNPKPGNILPQETLDNVEQFYQSGDVSRMMPGKKDCVTKKIGGEKVKVQKKQILFTVYDTYLQFKELNPNIKIGFSKFAEHRP